MDIDISARSVAIGVSGLGAVNWGLMELADFNLVTELLGADGSGIAYLAVGLAGVLTLTEEFEVTEFFDD